MDVDATMGELQVGGWLAKACAVCFWCHVPAFACAQRAPWPDHLAPAAHAPHRLAATLPAPTGAQEEERRLRAEQRAAKGQADTPTTDMYQDCMELLTVGGPAACLNK